MQQQNRYLDFLINPSFKQVIRLFVLSFKSNGGRTSYTRYYLPLVEIKNCNVVIDGRNFFDQPAKNNLITYGNIWKIATGQGDDYTTGCLIDYNSLNNYYKMIAKDLSKQQALDADQKKKKKTANQFFCKSRSRREHKNVFHYRRSEKNNFRVFTGNCLSCYIISFTYSLNNKDTMIFYFCP